MTDDGREHGDAAQAEAFTKQPPMSRVSAELIKLLNKDTIVYDHFQRWVMFSSS